jgi:hypothetical protein
MCFGTGLPISVKMTDVLLVVIELNLLADCLKIYPSLCLLIGVCNPFQFNAITDQ